MCDNISYRLATQEDRDELRALISVCFPRDEPFNSHWINDDPVPEDVEHTLHCLDEGMSFMAVDDSKKKIVGACMTCIDYKGTSIQHLLDDAKTTTNRKFAKYLELYAKVESNADMFERYGVDKIFHVSALGVDSDYRGLSIGRNLVDKSFNLGRSQGHKLCSINCSSFFTEKIAIKLEMEYVSEIAMADIKDEAGNRLTFPPPPHTHIRTYAKRL